MQKIIVDDAAVRRQEQFEIFLGFAVCEHGR